MSDKVPTSEILAERIRAAIARCETQRAETERLLAKRRALARTYFDLVLDRAWFMTMAKRDLGLITDLDVSTLRIDDEDHPRVGRVNLKNVSISAMSLPDQPQNFVARNRVLTTQRNLLLTTLRELADAAESVVRTNVEGAMSRFEVAIIAARTILATCQDSLGDAADPPSG